MILCDKKAIRVALLLVGGAILLSACEEQRTVSEESPLEVLMTEYSENRTIIATENGVRQYQFFAPLLEGYTAGDEPYREFRRGIRMTTFKKDSTDEVDVTLTANYAIYYEKRKLWEAKGNVVVRKFDGKTLYTEQLFWNDVTNKIYSNVDTKIVENDGETFVSGFESDEEFHFWSAREMDGRMEVEFTPTPPDSTAVAESDRKTTKKSKRPTLSDEERERRREETRQRAAKQRAERQANATKQSAPRRPQGAAPANFPMRNQPRQNPKERQQGLEVSPERLAAPRGEQLRALPKSNTESAVKTAPKAN